MTPMERHSAGAISQHTGPFSTIEVTVNYDNPDREYVNKWIMPFYKWRGRDPERYEEAFYSIQTEISPEVCLDLLTYFNWRPRITGAFFAAILQFAELESVIRKLLLRSDVCFAGDGYTLALARFNTPNSSSILCEYLDYYLPRITELPYNQYSALAALHHLDRLNGTDYLRRYPITDLERTIDLFSQHLALVERLASKA